MRIAAILAAYNRREKTLACLAGLQGQGLGAEHSVQVFLTDDASPDGTAVAVRSSFPRVNILTGNGNLFWDGGMRLAFGEALRSNFDAYLWLNDDTILFPDCIARMIDALFELRREGHIKGIVVGSTCDKRTGIWTYGGAIRSSGYHPLKFKPVRPGESLRRCDTFNGNCVLIPRHVAEIVGNISAGFTQGMGDFDYGLRSQQLGCSVWVAPGFVGYCSRNSNRGSWEDTELSLRERWKAVCGPKGLPPAEYRRYAARHAGRLWFLYWSMPYARLVVTWALSRIPQAISSLCVPRRWLSGGGDWTS